MALMEIVVSPRNTRPGISDSLVPAMRLLEASGLTYQVHAMGTLVEGDVEALLALAAKMHSASFSDDTPRVVTSLRIDDRRDKELTLDGKVDSLRRSMAGES